jgi:osmotically inducible lipoprotein OsmB
VRKVNAITLKRIMNSAVIAAVLLGFSACSSMSRQGQDTAVGAGVGAVGGAVLTGGSAVGTLGGAAIGGIVGHEAGKDKR